MNVPSSGHFGDCILTHCKQRNPHTMNAFCGEQSIIMNREYYSKACLCVRVQECTPFAVIGSNTVVEARGQRVRGRLYPWGIVEGAFFTRSLCVGKPQIWIIQIIHVLFCFFAQWKTSRTVTL